MKLIYRILIIWLLPLNLLGQNVAPQPIPYCESINASNIGSYDGEHLGYFCYDISKNTTAPTNVYPSSAQGLSLKPSSHVHIHDETHIKPTGNSQFTAKIEDPDIYAAWFEPNGSSGWAHIYKTMELGFNIPDLQIYINNGILNPYDPDELDFQVEVTDPNGATKTQYGFYYEQYDADLNADEWVIDNSNVYNWRFRFAPNIYGFWTYKVKMIANINGVIEEYKMNLRIECGWTDDNPHKGRLVVTQGNRYLKYANGESFFAIGNGVSKSGFQSLNPHKLNRWLDGVQGLVDVGANYTRFDLEAQGALPDWPDVLPNSAGIKPGNVGDYSQKQNEMYAFDQVLKKCEDNGIYYTIFRHHVEVQDSIFRKWHSDILQAGATTIWDGVSWQQNPYKNQFGYTEYVEYFNDPIALEYHLKTLRYICARWGYSSNFAFYGFSELEIWLNHKPANGDDMLAWLDQQKSYVKNVLKYEFGFTSSFGSKNRKILTDGTGNTGSFSITEKVEMDNMESSLYNFHNDVIHRHVYGESKAINYSDRFKATKGYEQSGLTNVIPYFKPVLIEEMGTNENKTKIYCCTKLEYHNGLWSTAMMGGYGAGLDWWWDKGIHTQGYHHDLENLKVFFDGEDLFDGNYVPKRWKNSLLVDWRTVENYYLLRGDKTRVLGWANNAASYWANVDSECVDNLKNDGYPGVPCPTTDGDNNVTGHDPYNFTPDPVTTWASNQDVKVKGLKNSEYYLIELHTTEGFANPNYFTNGIVKTNALGTLTFTWYFTTEQPDVAYKISYLEDYEGIWEGEEIDTIIDFTNQDGSDRSQNWINDNGQDEIDGNLISYNQLKIFPNPSNGLLNIQSSRKEIGEIKLVDVYGNLILKENLVGPNSQIDIGKLANGVYFLFNNNKKYKVVKST